MSILEFIGAKNDGSGSENWRYKTCTANHPLQQTDTQLFTGRMPFMSPNQQLQRTEARVLTLDSIN